MVEDVEGMFVYEGSYEYTARVTDLGNSGIGRQIGKNIIRFTDGTIIEFELPIMKISGLIFGKRTV